MDLSLPQKIFFGLLGIILLLLCLHIGGYSLDHFLFEEATLHPSLFVLSTFEELLKMIGVSYFIFSVLQFLYRHKTPGVQEIN